MSQNEEINPPRHHYRYLDGIRAYLALYVVASHCYQTGTRDGLIGSIRVFGLLNFGHFAVCFFIVLSGFCLALPVLKTELRLPHGSVHFFRQRAWRILPPYYFALLGSLLLVATVLGNFTGTHWDLALPYSAHSVVTHLLLLQNFFPADFSKINHVLWSIAVEWQIYFFFPLLLWISRKISIGMCSLLVMIISIIIELGAVSFLAPLDFIYETPSIHFLGLFALGMFAAEISFAKTDSVLRFRRLPWLLITGLLFLCFGVLKTFQHSAGLSQLQPIVILDDVIFGALGAAMLVTAAVSPRGWLHSLLSLKPFAFIGTFSYSLYLVHAPIIQLLWQYPLKSLQNNPNVMVIALLLAGIPVAVLLSYLFFLFAERPFMRKKIGQPQAPAHGVPATLSAPALLDENAAPDRTRHT